MEASDEILKKLREQIPTREAMKSFADKVDMRGVYSNQSWKTEKEYLEGNFQEILRKSDRDPKFKTRLYSCLNIPTLEVRQTVADERSASAGEDAVIKARRANRIAWCALVVAVASLVIGLVASIR